MTRAQRARISALILVALLAGCFETRETAEPPEADAELVMTDCDQTHTFATYPVEAFEGMLPPEWSLQPADPLGRTTSFYLSGSACAESFVTRAGIVDANVLDLKEVFGYLFVVPPNGTTEGLAGDLWPLGGIVSHGEVLDAYTEWGFDALVVQGRTEITIDELLGGILSSRTYGSSGTESFEVTAAAQEERAEFPAGAFRIWVPAEGGVSGSFVSSWSAAEDLGLGSGDLRYEGPLLNAPPLGPVMVHHVQKMNVTMQRSSE